MSEQATSEMRLPTSIITKADLVRLVHEVEQLDVDFTTASVHDKAGVKSHWQPVLSAQLNDYLTLNPVELEKANDRRDVIKQLRQLKKTAPVVHMAFASTADRESLQKIVDWLRESAHPQAVIAVGLQPDLVGGTYIRTTNHVHDFSLRAKLAGHRHLIREQVEAISARG